MQLTEQHRAIMQTVARFVDEEINPHVEAWEKAEEFPSHALFKKLGNLGLLGVQYPEAYGGLGLDYSYALTIAEELGRAHCGGVPMAIGVQASMCTPALARFGTDDLATRPSRTSRGTGRWPRGGGVERGSDRPRGRTRGGHRSSWGFSQ